MAAMGIKDFPQPLITPAAQWEKARRKKNSAVVRQWMTPNSMASGAFTKILIA